MINFKVNYLLIFINQIIVILLLLTQFGITSSNLSYFVFNNSLNNNIIFVELIKTLRFNLKVKRLRYINYIFNLITE